MNSAQRIPRELNLACRRHGILPTRFIFAVSITRQTASVFESRLQQPIEASFNEYALFKKYRCSTSRFGIGEVAGSNMTPRGLHRIAEKIGDGCPIGAVFKERKIVGYTSQGFPDAAITTRIMWLEGLEPGFNRGGNVDSYARYIYIHGTGNESTIGHPASHGCVHLAAEDLIPLYDKLPIGTLVWISER
ncbi:MAG: L,D-transpeptidase [Verrucomicrobiota bacterium]